MFVDKIENIMNEMQLLQIKKDTLEHVSDIATNVISSIKDILSKLECYADEKQIFINAVCETIGIIPDGTNDNSNDNQTTNVTSNNQQEVPHINMGHEVKQEQVKQVQAINMELLACNNDIGRGHEDNKVFLYVGFDKEKGRNGSSSARGWKNYIEKRWDDCEIELISDVESILNKKHLLKIYQRDVRRLEVMLSDGLKSFDFSLSPQDNEQLHKDELDSRDAVTDKQYDNQADDCVADENVEVVFDIDLNEEEVDPLDAFDHPLSNPPSNTSSSQPQGDVSIDLDDDDDLFTVI